MPNACPLGWYKITTCANGHGEEGRGGALLELTDVLGIYIYVLCRTSGHNVSNAAGVDLLQVQAVPAIYFSDIKLVNYSPHYCIASSRFFKSIYRLKKFFFDAGNMGYVRALVPIPVLPQVWCSLFNTLILQERMLLAGHLYILHNFINYCNFR